MKSSRDEERKARTVVGTGGGRACYVTPDLSYDHTVGGREKKKGEDKKLDDKTKRKKLTVHGCAAPFKPSRVIASGRRRGRM